MVVPTVPTGSRKPQRASGYRRPVSTFRAHLVFWTTAPACASTCPDGELTGHFERRRTIAGTYGSQPGPTSVWVLAGLHELDHDPVIRRDGLRRIGMLGEICIQRTLLRGL